MNTSFSIKIVDLLKETFTCTFDTQRQAVEQELQALASNWLDFLQTLLGILTTQHPDISNEMRLGAASYILAKVRNREDIKDTLIYSSAELIYKKMLEIDPSDKVSELLTSSLELLLQSQDEEMTLAKEFLSQLPVLIRSNPSRIPMSLRLLRALFSCESSGLLDFVGKITPDLIEIAEACLNATLQPIVLVEWTRTVDQMVKYAVSGDPSPASFLANDPNLASVFLKILTFRPFVDSDLLMICVPADDSLRECKLFALRAVSTLFLYVIDNKQQELERFHHVSMTSIVGFSLPEIPCTQLVGQLLPLILENLTRFCEMSELGTRLKEETVADEVVEALGLLTKASSDSLYNPFFFKTQELFLVTRVDF